jgi:D-glycero-alpha-D-manno-heptose-7-phosphate kinase
MSDTLREFLEAHEVEASAPCRIDLGGTLDISTFYYPLRHLNPCTFNIALDLRTRVKLLPFDRGMVKVSSKGFESAVYPKDRLPFDHPLGLMFAIAAYFQTDGVHIAVESASPPKSALGGSSVASVALIGAFSMALHKIGVCRQLYRREIAILAHELEQSVAGIPCGLQDQLAAAYGGVNAWFWHGRVKEAVFEKDEVVKKSGYPDLEKRLLLAYCGIPHESRDINQRWVRQFLSGEDRTPWAEIVRRTQLFIEALKKQRYEDAVEHMNQETRIRREMTPDVLEDIGEELAAAAQENQCGFRFTGAGGGGCVWALGDAGNIDNLKNVWEKVLSKRDAARLLEAKIDSEGLTLPIL